MYYDINGNVVNIENGVDISYKRDDNSGAFYTLLKISQTKPDGSKQYPFVLWSNYPNGGIESTLEMNERKNYVVAINAGRFNSPYGAGVTLTGLPTGTVIQNGVVLQQGTSDNTPSVDRVLTIDENGALGYANFTDSATDLVTGGVVSAVTGFIPIIVNYDDIQDIDESVTYIDNTTDSQRQVIGQYENGDYAIVSIEGRDYQGGGYCTVRQVQALCKSLGLKFAFVLDGGGSMETVVGQRQLNPIYDNTKGRVVPTYIVFNGTTEFSTTG